MNAKQLIAAVIAMTAIGTAFADQNASRPFTGKTRADAVSVKQQAQKTQTAATYHATATPNAAFNRN